MGESPVMKEPKVNKKSPSVGTIQKVLTVSFFVAMAGTGVANIVIGFVNLDGCGNAMVVPVLLVMNGVLWLLPALLVAAINCQHEGEGMDCLLGCVDKLMVLTVAFIMASTIYLLVTVTQVKTLDSLCTHSWVPPYALAILIADWLFFFVFYRLFCVHNLPPEHPPPQFRHLKNLPPLSSFPWNRHRALRKY